MSKLRAIVIIVPDQALNRSLAFSLEADGYRVATFSSLSSASKALASSLCIIADDSVLPKKDEAPNILSAYAERTLLMREHGVMPRLDAMTVLTKPLSGADVLAAVARFLPPPRSKDTSYV